MESNVEFPKEEFLYTIKSADVDIHGQGKAKDDAPKLHQKEGDAGADIYTGRSFGLPERTTSKISTGIYVRLPINVFALVLPRSSAMAKGLVIQGVVDNGYHGELKLIIHNTTDECITVSKDVSVAQLVLFNTVPQLPKLVSNDIFGKVAVSERGSGGFGSTGNALK